ncbi:MAG: hypothetical protein RL339_103 [Pseudomonadota bacterium]|jgi:hypothetical protein
MDQTDTRFDWISWLASVPGIPADWGSTSPPAAVPELQDPLPLAA